MHIPLFSITLNYDIHFSTMDLKCMSRRKEIIDMSLIGIFYYIKYIKYIN